MNSDMELEENVEKGQGEEIKFSNVEVNNLVVPEENDGEKLRGDAIGSTLYSESGLLKTLINLSKVIMFYIFSPFSCCWVFPFSSNLDVFISSVMIVGQNSLKNSSASYGT